MKSERPEIVVLGGGIAGCGTALELADAGYSVTVIEELAELLSGTSAKMARRLSLGFHYPADEETALKNFYATLAFLKKYSGFRVGEAPGKSNPGKCRYFIVKDSRIPPEQILRVYTTLQETYRKLCAEDPSNQVLGDPDHFFRILDESEYPAEASTGKIAMGIEAAESIVDWPRFNFYLKQEISKHSNIRVLCGTTAQTITPVSAPEGKQTFLIACSAGKITADLIINCTWHNIESLDKQLGFSNADEQRTLRLKAMAEVQLPEDCLDKASAVFCVGPHAAFTNLQNGRAFVTYESATNVEASTGLHLSEHGQQLLRGSPEIARESLEIGTAILKGAVEYMPWLSNTTLMNVQFGVVRVIGSNLQTAIDTRRESGVAEQGIGYIDNASMKWVYFVINAEQVRQIVRRTEHALQWLNEWVEKAPTDNPILRKVSRQVWQHQLSSSFFAPSRHGKKLVETFQQKLQLTDEIALKLPRSKL